jgi:predicted TIM-barrel fold metal-dependent hydrolase
MKWKNRKALAYDLNNPKRWEPVLDMFPKLKISFAHFGGSSTWKSCTKVRSNIDPQHRKETIISFMNKYPNVYADFAFNFIEDNIWDNIINVLLYNKRVRERLMFGTDYWVVNPKVNLKLKQNEFIKHLKDSSKSDIDLVDILTFQNPVKFFFESELNRNLNKKLRPSNKIKLI